MVLFGIAAFRPSLVDGLVSGRRGVWIEWTSAVTVAGVNLPLAVATLWLAWETFRSAWRWADEVAVTITDVGLLPHGSLFMARMKWSEIGDIRLVQIPRGRMIVPALQIALRNGRSRMIRGIDNEDGAADRFAAAARARLVGGEASQG